MNMSRNEGGLFRSRLEYYLGLEDSLGHEIALGRFITELYRAGYDGYANRLMNRAFYPERD